MLSLHFCMVILIKRSLWSNQKASGEREGEHGLQVKQKSIWT